MILFGILLYCKRGSSKGILKWDFSCWLVGCHQIYVYIYLKQKVDQFTGSLFDSFQTRLLSVSNTNIHKQGQADDEGIPRKGISRGPGVSIRVRWP